MLETCPMLTPRLSLRQALFARENIEGPCPSGFVETIYGWGQYIDDVDLLPPLERQKISDTADLVVSSFAVTGCVPLGQIEVIGHADHDRHGKEFEHKVSEERARSVGASLSTAIIDRWKRRHMGPFRKGAIAFSIVGVRATEPDAQGAAIRERNRRVVVSVSPMGVPVPPIL